MRGDGVGAEALPEKLEDLELPRRERGDANVGRARRFVRAQHVEKDLVTPARDRERREGEPSEARAQAKEEAGRRDRAALPARSCDRAVRGADLSALLKVCIFFIVLITCIEK